MIYSDGIVSVWAGDKIVDYDIIEGNEEAAQDEENHYYHPGIGNSVLIVAYAVTGRLTVETISYSAMLLPVVLVGIVVGELLHRWINERHFRIVIFCILIVAGLSILVRLMLTSQ